MIKINLKKIGLNNIFIALIILTIISCNNNEAKQKSNNLKKAIAENKIIDGKIINSTIYNTHGRKIKFIEYLSNNIVQITTFHDNGNVHIKGQNVNNKPIGWWKIFDSEEKLIEEREYILHNDKKFLNQIIFYDLNGKIISEKSSYFKLNIPDTIHLGKNEGRINLFIEKTKDARTFFSIVIENTYNENKIVSDTFNITNDNRFGIYASKHGKLNIKGTIIERVIHTKRINSTSDSLEMNTQDYFRNFEKEVFVK